MENPEGIRSELTNGTLMEHCSGLHIDELGLEMAGTDYHADKWHGGEHNWCLEVRGVVAEVRGWAVVPAVVPAVHVHHVGPPPRPGSHQHEQRPVRQREHQAVAHPGRTECCAAHYPGPWGQPGGRFWPQPVHHGLLLGISRNAVNSEQNTRGEDNHEVPVRVPTEQPEVCAGVEPGVRRKGAVAWRVKKCVNVGGSSGLVCLGGG